MKRLVFLFMLIAATAQAQVRIPSGVTDQVAYFVAVDSTDFTTRETGLTTFTVYRSRNGGTATAMTTPTVAELDATNMPGVYSLLLDEDMTIDAGDDTQEMAFHITQASMAPVTRTIELFRPKITVGETFTVASGEGEANVLTWNGTAVATPDTGGYPVVTVKDGTGTGEIDTLSGLVAIYGAGTNAISANALHPDVAEEIADGMYTAINSTTIASFTSNTQFILDDGSADDDAYNNMLVIVRDQITADQLAVGVVLNYIGATKELFLRDDPGIFTFADNDAVRIVAISPDLLEILADTGTTGVASVTGNVAGNVTGNVTGSVGDVLAISGSTAAADNAEIVLATDFAVNYDATDKRWITEIGVTGLANTSFTTGAITSTVWDTTASAEILNYAITTDLTSGFGDIGAGSFMDITGDVVNSEVLDVLTVDTFAEPTSVADIPVAATPMQMLNFVKTYFRNKRIVDTTGSGEHQIYADDTTTVLWEFDATDNGAGVTTISEVRDDN